MIDEFTGLIPEMVLPRQMLAFSAALTCLMARSVAGQTTTTEFVTTLDNGNIQVHFVVIPQSGSKTE